MQYRCLLTFGLKINRCVRYKTQQSLFLMEILIFAALTETCIHICLTCTLTLLLKLWLQHVSYLGYCILKGKSMSNRSLKIHYIKVVHCYSSQKVVWTLKCYVSICTLVGRKKRKRKEREKRLDEQFSNVLGSEHCKDRSKTQLAWLLPEQVKNTLFVVSNILELNQLQRYSLQVS